MEWNIANSWTIYVLSTLTKTGPNISSEVCLSETNEAERISRIERTKERMNKRTNARMNEPRTDGRTDEGTKFSELTKAGKATSFQLLIFGYLCLIRSKFDHHDCFVIFRSLQWGHSNWTPRLFSRFFLSVQFESRGFRSRRSLAYESEELDSLFPSPDKLLLAERRVLEAELNSIKAVSGRRSNLKHPEPKRLNIWLQVQAVRPSNSHLRPQSTLT